MNKYKLLTLATGRRGGALFWIGLLLLAVAAADQFYLPFLGSFTMIVWAVGGLAVVVAILFRLPSPSQQSGYIQVEEDGLTVRYGRHELWVGYEEIDTVTGGRVSQHYSLKELDRRDRQAVKPYFNQTHVFVALHEETEALQEAKTNMPQFMFGTTQPGLLLLIEGDWITVERAIDAARVAWHGRMKEAHQGDNRYLAPGLWKEEEDEEDEEEEWDSDLFSS